MSQIAYTVTQCRAISASSPPTPFPLDIFTYRFFLLYTLFLVIYKPVLSPSTSSFVSVLPLP